MKETKKKKILVTSALPYVNNVPHLGTMVCVLSADVYSRFLKLRKIPNIYVCGTDEHGTATETKAVEEGVTPKEICDKYFKLQKEIYEWFNCDFDCFGRTSDKANHEIAIDIFNKLEKKEFIFEQETEQFFCEHDKRFLADRFVVGICPYCEYKEARGDQCESCGKLLNPTELKEPRCKICNNKPIIRKTKHLFIDLPKLEPEIKKWVDEASEDWSNNAKTMTNAWLKEGLKPRAITRDIRWGIPVPKKGYEQKVFYCWFDAPIGYISITKQCKEEWKKWWHNPEKIKLVQFMGKDNIPFHTIMFPAFLIGTRDNYTLLDQISSNEYMNYESGQFSKSRGTGIFGDDAMNSGISADAYRYYIMTNRPEKTDTEFTWNDFQDKINNELVANIGNLVNRTISFIHRFYEDIIPEANIEPKDNEFIEKVKQREEKVKRLLEQIKLKEALREIMSISRLGNQYFQENEPWKAFKENKKRADTTMNVLANIVKDLSILIEPYMPNTAKRIRAQIGMPEKKLHWINLGYMEIEKGHKTNPPRILFDKLEDEQVEEFKQKYAGKQKKEKKEMNANLKVAEILEVNDHPDADKLYILKTNLGEEQKQLVAGLKKYYKPEELIGKKIIIVTNLKPAKLRGVESQGMLLAAEDKNNVEIIELHHSHPGDQVFVEEQKIYDKEITIDEMFENKLEVKNKEVLFNKEKLKTDTEEIKTKIVVKGKVR